MGKGSRRWQRKHGKEKRKPSAPPKPMSKPMRWAAEEDQQFRKEFSFFYTRAFKILLLSIVLIAGFVVRLSTLDVCLKTNLLLSDDDHWHYNILQSMSSPVRPQIINSWFPEGRLNTHPPLFHVFMYYFSHLYSDTFMASLWVGPFLGLLGTLAWFILIMELHQSFYVALFGTALYSAFPWIVRSRAGSARPLLLAEPLALTALWLFYYAYRTKKVWVLPLPGFFLGLACLTWEASLILYLPLIIIGWLLTVSTKQATKYMHTLCVLTLAIASAMALSWFHPVYATYGLYENTPSFMMMQTATFSTADWPQFFLAWLQYNHVWFILGLICFPIILLGVAADKKWLMQDYIAIVYMIAGLMGLFFLGWRVQFAFLPIGVALSITAAFSKIWNPTLYRERDKVIIGVALCVILTLNMVHVYVTGLSIAPRYIELSPLQSYVETGIPRNSVILCWWTESAFFLSQGHRALWDGYMEHLPKGAEEKAKLIARFYLSQDEREAWQIARNLGANYVLAHINYVPYVRYMLAALGQAGSEADYFGWISVVEEREMPQPPSGFEIENPPENIVFVEKTFGGYELAPLEKGRNLLLSSLLWNMETRVLKNKEFMPPPPLGEYFKLLWVSDDRICVLYEVVET